MSDRFPQVIWLATLFLKTSSRRPEQSKSLWFLADTEQAKDYTREEPRSVRIVFVCPSCVVYNSLCSSLPGTTDSREASDSRSSVEPIFPALLFAGSVCPLLESDWPLALDWNWLYKGYNNERLLVFLQWQWRSVKGWDAAVTRTTGFYINILSSSHIPKMGVGLWSERYCVSNWVILIRTALVTAQSGWMSVCCAEEKNWSNQPNVALSSPEPSQWFMLPGFRRLERNET